MHGKFVSSVLLPEDFQSSRRCKSWCGGIAAARFSLGGLGRGCQSPAESGCFAASQGQMQSLREVFVLPRATQYTPLAIQIE